MISVQQLVGATPQEVENQKNHWLYNSKPSIYETYTTFRSNLLSKQKKDVFTNSRLHTDVFSAMSVQKGETVKQRKKNVSQFFVKPIHSNDLIS